LHSKRFHYESAGVSYFLLKTSKSNLQDGQGILIVDAGGGTIDVSAYKKTSLFSKSYEEIAPPQCLNIVIFSYSFF
jgi:cell division ATPase FtsA